jgi:hypothetical protein
MRTDAFTSSNARANGVIILGIRIGKNIEDGAAVFQSPCSGDSLRRTVATTS